tara:strand:- start:63 stop:305 length:243 start_codon:yes stop_codon:yes gene_type:complete
MKFTCCKCEDQVDQDSMDTEERMCYDCLDDVKEEFEEEPLSVVGEVEFFDFMKKNNRHLNGYQRFIAINLVKTWLKRGVN